MTIIWVYSHQPVCRLYIHLCHLCAWTYGWQFISYVIYLWISQWTQLLNDIIIDTQAMGGRQVQYCPPFPWLAFRNYSKGASVNRREAISCERPQQPLGRNLLTQVLINYMHCRPHVSCCWPSGWGIVIPDSKAWPESIDDIIGKFAIWMTRPMISVWP